MGLFDRKKPKNEKSVLDRINEISKELEELSSENSDLALVFLASNKNQGLTAVCGEGRRLYALLRNSAESDFEFAAILKKASKDANVDINEMIKSLPPEIQELGEKKLKEMLKNPPEKSVEKIDLPNGGKALKIDASNIDNLSDEDVDKIINGIINGDDDSEG